MLPRASASALWKPRPHRSPPSATCTPPIPTPTSAGCACARVQIPAHTSSAANTFDLVIARLHRIMRRPPGDRLMTAPDRPPAAQEVAPLVYDELRRIAAAYMRRERPGQTLQATALVHEAYLRLASAGTPWHDQRHLAGHREAAVGAGARLAVSRAERIARMTPDRRQRVAELFEAALDRDAESAAQWIAREAADDPAVRDEALSLLASHSRAGAFL